LPFYAVCKPRDLGTYGLSAVWRFIYFGIVFCCLALGVFIPPIGVELTDKFARLLMGTTIAAIVAALLKGVERLYQAYVRWRLRLPGKGEIGEEISKTFSYPRLRGERFIAISVSRDEALASLVSGQFGSAAFAFLYKMLGFLSILIFLPKELANSELLQSRGKIFLLILAGAGVFWLGDEMSVTAVTAIGAVTIVIGILLLVAERALTVISVLMALCLGPPLLLFAICVSFFALVFGPDVCAIACLFELSVTQIPPLNGVSRLLTGPFGRGLRHSAPYNSPETFMRIKEWLVVS
jgi:hypothetical protein